MACYRNIVDTRPFQLLKLNADKPNGKPDKRRIENGTEFRPSLLDLLYKKKKFTNLVPRFIVSLGLINMVLRLFKPFTYRTSRLTKADSMDICCVRCTRNHEVFDNSFKQALHRMNQPYLVWAAVFSWFRPGHTLTPSGNWVPNCCCYAWSLVLSR